MKLLVTIITFALTLGGLFLIETGRSSKENYAQIIEMLKDKNISVTAPIVSSPIKSRFQSQAAIPAPTRPGSFQSTPISALTITPAQNSSPEPSFIKPSLSPAISTAFISTPTPSSEIQETRQGFIDIVSITSPIKQNSTAQLNISTLPNAQCFISVMLPSGNRSSAKGLEAKKADPLGNVSWLWKINWRTTPGIANIEVTCAKDGQDFSKSLQMTIIEK
jgi:hypothetical protein